MLREVTKAPRVKRGEPSFAPVWRCRRTRRSKLELRFKERRAHQDKLDRVVQLARLVDPVRWRSICRAYARLLRCAPELTDERNLTCDPQWWQEPWVALRGAPKKTLKERLLDAKRQGFINVELRSPLDESLAVLLPRLRALGLNLMVTLTPKVNGEGARAMNAALFAASRAIRAGAQGLRCSAVLFGASKSARSSMALLKLFTAQFHRNTILLVEGKPAQLNGRSGDLIPWPQGRSALLTAIQQRSTRTLHSLLEDLPAMLYGVQRLVELEPGDRGMSDRDALALSILYMLPATPWLCARGGGQERLSTLNRLVRTPGWRNGPLTRFRCAPDQLIWMKQIGPHHRVLLVANLGEQPARISLPYGLEALHRIVDFGDDRYARSLDSSVSGPLYVAPERAVFLTVRKKRAA